MPPSGHTRSWWHATTSPITTRRLSHPATCDVCVVGAGIAGMSAAYLLAREGKRVLVLDDGPVGGGETGRTTAHLASALDDRFHKLQSLFGEDGARLAMESHHAAINRIEEIVRLENIDCEFERLPGYLFPAKPSHKREIEKEYEAAKESGFADLRMLESGPVPSIPGPCIRFQDQGQFHPLRYLAGLCRAIELRGGRVHTDTHVDAIEEKEGRVTITTSGSVTVTADACVVATNSPISDMVVTHTKMSPYRTFAVALRIPKGAVPRALYWDTEDPYHYVRLADGTTDGEEVIITGGEDHKTGHADDAEERFGHLESWTRERFPEAGATVARWSGQVLEPAEMLGMIGRNPGKDTRNVYIATGDSGHGMTHGTIAGILLTDLIMGRDNPWAEIYDPSRARIGASPVIEFVKHNADVVFQFAKDYLRPGEVGSADEIAPGQGALMRDGTTIIAAYRDEAGTVYRRKAACTHMKCIVHWNSAERSWDCPCHGSRFDPMGKVLNGPAVEELGKLED